MIRFLLSDFWWQNPGDESRFDYADVDVGATLEVATDSGVLFVEELFPALEFASQLQDWIVLGAPRGRSFEYHPLAWADPEDLASPIYFRPTDGGWVIWCFLMGERPSPLFTLDELVEAAGDFVEGVREVALSTYGLDVSPFLQGDDRMHRYRDEGG